MFDGNPATSWHTTPGTLYPFHATIDLQEPMVITSVELTGRSVQPPQVEGPDRVGFELSADGENWVKAGSFAFNRQDPFSVQSYDIFQAQYEVRYLKLILLEGPSPYSYMGEVNVKGKLR